MFEESQKNNTCVCSFWMLLPIVGICLICMLKRVPICLELFICLGVCIRGFCLASVLLLCSKCFCLFMAFSTRTRTRTPLLPLSSTMPQEFASPFLRFHFPHSFNITAYAIVIHRLHVCHFDVSCSNTLRPQVIERPPGLINA